MKTIIIAILVTLPSIAFAGSVNGYYRQNGTYVAPHYRSNPDNSTLNNWSTKGNINPYTGQMGTRNPTLGQVPNYGGFQKPSITYQPSKIRSFLND